MQAFPQELTEMLLQQFQMVRIEGNLVGAEVY